MVLCLVFITGKKRKRCGHCNGCRAEDCGTCKYCIDNPRFGGQGRKNQCCVARKCTNMKQTSPNQASEMYQWSIQLREHLAHLPQGTNCSLSSVCITPPPTTEGYKAILTSLEQQNCNIDKIQGDRNCMFPSLSKELFGSEKYHLDLRKLVTDFEYCNLQLQPESSSKETCMHYINNMKNETVWGTTTELLSFASMLQTPIFTFTKSVTCNKYSWHQFKPFSLQKLSFHNPALRTLAARFAKLDYHIELLHYENCYYYRITSATNTAPALPIPKLEGIVESKNLVIVV